MEEDRRVDPDDTEVPLSVRAAVLRLWQPGDSLWRCPSRAGRKSWCSKQRRIVIEWWLIDASGELVNAFWEVP